MGSESRPRPRIGQDASLPSLNRESIRNDPGGNLAFCPKCGEMVSSEALFCPSCGSNLRLVLDDKPAPAQQEPIPQASSRIPRLLRNVVTVILIAIILILAVGSVITTTTTVLTIGTGNQQSSEIVTCHGFGLPTYSTTGPLSIAYSVSTSRYGSLLLRVLLPKRNSGRFVIDHRQITGTSVAQCAFSFCSWFNRKARA